MATKLVDLIVRNWKGAIARINRENPFPVAEVFGGPNSGSWEIDSHYNGDPDSSDKTYTVPETQEVQVFTIFVDYTSTAAPGDRQLQLLFQNAQAQTILDIRPNVVQAASLQRFYSFGPSLANQLAFYDTDQIQTPIPPTLFGRGNYTLRIWDNNAVDVGDDDMLVTIAFGKRIV